jgi:hypothetical protein
MASLTAFDCGILGLLAGFILLFALVAWDMYGSPRKMSEVKTFLFAIALTLMLGGGAVSGVVYATTPDGPPQQLVEMRDALVEKRAYADELHRSGRMSDGDYRFAGDILDHATDRYNMYVKLSYAPAGQRDGMWTAGREFSSDMTDLGYLLGRCDGTVRAPELPAQAKALLLPTPEGYER